MPTRPDEADDMPGLVHSQGTFEPQSPREKILSRGAHSYSHRSMRWLWVAVSLFTLIILGLWGFSMFSQLQFFNWSKTGEAELYKETITQWNLLMKDTPPPVSAEVKERLSDVIKQAAINAATTTTTSTTSATTTKPTTKK